MKEKKNKGEKEREKKREGGWEREGGKKENY